MTGGAMADAADQASPPAKADVGVVFVHGIGSQVQGQTLLQFGEPLFRWLFRWLGDGMDPHGSDANRAVSLTKMVLHPDSSSEPARCSVALETPPASFGEKGAHQDWLLAESCWSDVFTAPPFTRMAFWLITYAPWLALDFMRQIIVRAWTTKKRADLKKLWSIPLFFVVGPVVGLIVVLFTLAVLLLSLIPWRVTQKIAANVARALSRSIGDAYIVVGSPMNHAAMKARIKRDIDWVSKKSKRLVVVAHSQGAALVHEVLQDPTLPHVSLFLSVGSAVRRIAEFRQLREAKKGPWQVSGWIGILAGVWLSGAIWAGIVVVLGGHLDGWLTVFGGWWLLIGAVVVVALLYAAYRLVGHTLTTPRFKLLLPLDGDRRWVDCFATADPVPNGPLFESEIVLKDKKEEAEWRACSKRYKAVRTYNQRWMLNDHVTYPDNMDQFMSTLAGEIATTSGFDLLVSPHDKDLLDPTRSRRRFRTRLLSIFRGVFIAAAVFFFGAVARTANTSQHANLQDLSRWVQDHGPGWIWSLLTSITNPLAGRVKGLGLTQMDLIGALLLAAVMVIAYSLVGATWSFWDRGDSDRLFNRNVAPRSGPAVLFSAMGLLAIVACVVGSFIR
jgi:hypothetical protein